MANPLDDIAKYPRSKQVLVLAFFLGVLFFLFFWFIYLENQKELKRQRAEMEKLANQVQQLRVIAANIKRFQAEAAKLREELNTAMAQLPTSKEIPSLLANVSNLGKEAGLEFLLFKPTPEVNREFYAEIPVEMRVRGSYSDVAVFFDKVGRLPRIVNISGVAMEGAKEKQGKWELVTSCTAITFKFIDREPEEKKGKEEKKGAPAIKK